MLWHRCIKLCIFINCKTCLRNGFIKCQWRRNKQIPGSHCVLKRHHILKKLMKKFHKFLTKRIELITHKFIFGCFFLRKENKYLCFGYDNSIGNFSQTRKWSLYSYNYACEIHGYTIKHKIWLQENWPFFIIFRQDCWI